MPKLKSVSESMTQTEQRVPSNVQIRNKDPTYDAIHKQNRESGSSLSSSIHSYDSKSTLTNASDAGDNAIITRIRKSCEQKEEFLRRPSQPYVYNAPASPPMSLHSNVSPSKQPIIFENVIASAQHPQHREFYSRPNRLQKAMWPPSHELTVSPTIHQSAELQPPAEKHHMSIREQFFNSIQQQQQQSHRSPSPFTMEAHTKMEISDSDTNRNQIPNLRLVSELTKQFSSGRPLSPDGIDRTSLYRSELSRLQTKQVHPNVALRKREFELKAESEFWRRSTDKTRSSSVDSESHNNSSMRARSLSAESSRTGEKSLRDEPPIPPPREKHREHREMNKENNYGQKAASNVANWLQSIDEQSVGLNDSNSNINKSDMTTVVYFPATRFPFDEPQLRKMQQQHMTSKELKQAYRNHTIVEIHDIEMKDQSQMLERPQRPTTLNLSDGTAVKLRQKTATIIDNNDIDDNKSMRRISYLRATQGGHSDGAFHMDNDLDSSSPITTAVVSSSPADDQEAETPDADTETTINVQKVNYRPWRRPRFPTDIQPIRKLFEESPPHIVLPPIEEVPCVISQKHFFPQSHSTKDKALSHFRDSPADSSLPITHDGVLRVKITVLDGKRSSDRSWRTVQAEIRGNRLKLSLLREGKTNQQSPEPSGIIDLTNFHLTDGNYTKRKHVFKLTTNSCPPGSPSVTSIKLHERELLLQADSDHDMKVWMSVLGNVCRTNSTSTMSSDYLSCSQLAEPQTMPAIQTVQSSADEFSPVLSNKSQRKYNFDSRSPSGQSPVTKSRKTPLTPNAASGSQRDGSDKETGSPKSKTWKGIVARQFRRIGGAHNQETLPPEGVSFGVPLHMCVPSMENHYVPMILARCIEIVEAKGLGIVGIYRIPGNTAAITQLTEQVNRGFDEQTLNDPRWDDVNVVSSLLKAFIRNLPEPILPLDAYNRFIEADKLSGTKRLQELKLLLKKLPPHSYETMKYLIRHLHRVSQNCLVNLMEPRNLAIVFGPSLIRSANETLATAVKDMRHQCQIVEALVSHFPFFFENDTLPNINETNQSSFTESTLETQSKNLLLDNVHKIESAASYKESKDHSSRFVANIVQAANRKIRRTAQRKSNISSTVSSADTVSLDSTTSAESKGQRKLSYLSDSSGGNNKLTHPNTSIHSDRVVQSSEDDSNDSAFNDNGSMSLKTVTVTLDNKLRSLRDIKIDANNQHDSDNRLTNNENLNPSSNRSHLGLHRPLTLGENIPYADESPERPLIQPRAKPLRMYNNNNINTIVSDPTKNSLIDDSKTEISSSSDTDTSTTSNPREKLAKEDIRNEMREMNRMLLNLERKASNLERKIHLNRSLSLNYKNHKNNECCCRTPNMHYNNLHNSTLGIRSRLSLTKDEKTDKNISKRRQLLDSNLSPSNSAGQITTSGSATTINNKSRRHSGKDRSIRRRHTVGGSHDYNKHGAINDCERYIVTDVSSNTLKIDD
uniref:CSON003263 protein n=1 Tax=Culicoides sonorensis TaxID=179676 RepID=A0A336MS25_CULSO